MTQPKKRNKQPRRRSNHILRCAVIAIAGFSGWTQAQTSVSWLNAVSGTWTDGTKWSSNPAFPNNTSIAAYHTTVGATGASPYIVTLNTPITLSSLTLNAASATLLQIGGKLDIAGTIDVQAGTLLLNEGTLLNATINSSDSPLASVGLGLATLNSVTLNSNASMRFSASAFNNLTLLGGHQLSLDTSSSNVEFRLFGTQSILGSGEIVFTGPNASGVLNADAGTLVIASGITVRTGNGSGYVGDQSNVGALINRGLVWASSAGKELLVSNNWVNEGTLRVSAGTLNLGGVVNNGSTVLNLVPSMGSVDLGGTINGGTIRIHAGVDAVLTGRLNGVTIDADEPVPARVASVFGDLTLTDDTITLKRSAQDPNPNARLHFASTAGAQRLIGTGTIILDGDSGTDSIRDGVAGISTATFTVAPGITVRTGTNGGVVSGNGFVNEGTIAAVTMAKTLQVGGNGWKNAGVFKIDSGHLSLGGSFSTSAIGAVQREGGTLSISGSLNNSGTTLDLGRVPGPWQLGYVLEFGNASGQINGGTIAAAATGSTSWLRSIDGMLSNVSLDTDVVVDGRLSVSQGTISLLTGRTISLASPNAQVLAAAGGGSVQVTGGGSLVFNASDSRISAGDATLTIGPDITLRVQQGNGRLTSSSIGKVINQGTLLAHLPGTSLTLDGNWQNQGTIVVNDGTIVLGGTFSIGDIGTLHRNGGILAIGGTLLNAGTTLLADSTMGSITFVNGANISGGTLAGAASNPFYVATGSVTFDGTTVDADVVVQNGASLLLNNTNITNKTIRLASSGSLTTLTLNGAALTTSGNSTILFTTGSANQVIQQSGTLLIPSGITLRNENGGGGTLGNDSTPISNAGTISSQVPNAQIYVKGSSVSNSGVLEAKNGGLLTVKSLVGSAGSVMIGANSGANLTGTFTIHRPMSISPGGTISLGGSWVNMSSLVSDSATLLFGGSWSNTTGSMQFNHSDINLLSSPVVVGTMTLSDSTLHIQTPTFTSSKLKAISLNASTVSFDVGGLVDNSGDFISLDDIGDSIYRLNGATISGGSLTGSRSPLVVSTGGTLINIAINSPVNVLAGASLNLAGTWSNTGTITAVQSFVGLNGTPANIGSISISNGTLAIRGTVTTSQAASVNRVNSPMLLDGGTLNNAGGTFNTDLANGPFLFVNGAIIGGTLVSSGGSLSVLGTGVINGASIQVPVNVQSGKGLQLWNSFQNESAITLNGGSIVLAGTFNSGALGALVRSGGTITHSGTWNNSNSIIDLTQIGTLALNSGIIRGGTVIGNAASPLTLRSAATGTLSGVTLAAPITMENGSTLTILNGMTLSSATVGTGLGTIRFSGGQVLSGDGTIIASNKGIRVSSGSLTIAPGVTVVSPVTMGSLGGGSDIILNQGTALARGSGRFLNIGGNFTNQGAFEASEGGSLVTVGSLINLSAGTLTGGTWRVGAGSTITFGSATITTNNATIVLDGVGSIFAPINQLRTNLGRFTVTNGRDFSSAGSLTNSGTIVVGPGSTLNVAESFDNLSGLLDLNFKMVVDYGGASPLDELVGQIGSQIISSAVNADPGLAIGSIDDGNVVRLQIVANGDANLDGFVNYNDLTTLAGNYSGSNLVAGSLVVVPTSLNDPKWVDGDFNYDGAVNLTDLHALGWQYKDPQHPLTQSLQTLGLPAINVPEPALCAATIAMLSTLAARRRRR